MSEGQTREGPKGAGKEVLNLAGRRGAPADASREPPAERDVQTEGLNEILTEKEAHWKKGQDLHCSSPHLEPPLA